MAGEAAVMGTCSVCLFVELRTYGQQAGAALMRYGGSSVAVICDTGNGVLSDAASPPIGVTRQKGYSSP